MGTGNMLQYTEKLESSIPGEKKEGENRRGRVTYRIYGILTLRKKKSQL